MLAEMASSSLPTSILAKQRAAQLQHHCLFGALAVGKVARHLGVAGHAPGIVADGGQHDVGPEARAVFAHPPALFLDAPTLRGQAQQLRRPAAVHILLRKEAREVQSQNLIGSVALDALARRDSTSSRIRRGSSR